MEDRETPRMRKYGERKTTRIMMATGPHVISGRWIFVQQILRFFQPTASKINMAYTFREDKGRKNKSWVCNPRSGRLYHAAREHIYIILLKLRSILC